MTARRALLFLLLILCGAASLTCSPMYVLRAGIEEAKILSRRRPIPDVIADPHIAVRHMLVEVPRTDGVAEPILVPGNPVKMSKVAEGPEHRMPWVGEHTNDILHDELGLDDAELAKLRDAGIIT